MDTLLLCNENGQRRIRDNNNRKVMTSFARFLIPRHPSLFVKEIEFTPHWELATSSKIRLQQTFLDICAMSSHASKVPSTIPSKSNPRPKGHFPSILQEVKERLRVSTIQSPILLRSSSAPKRK
jgi:hypothetical protein